MAALHSLELSVVAAGAARLVPRLATRLAGVGVGEASECPAGPRAANAEGTGHMIPQARGPGRR
ncbi:MAG TPA: hypothetical protein VJ860_23550 [Polyangia bacterium]|nr:hypothetical protein [Polyangia bacterium]